MTDVTDEAARVGFLVRERDDLQAELRSIGGEEQPLDAAFRDRVAQRNTLVSRTPFRDRDRDTEAREEAEMVAAHDAAVREVRARGAVASARLNEVKNAIEEMGRRIVRQRAEVEAAEGRGDVDALAAEVDRATGTHQRLLDELAQIGTRRGSAFSAGDPKAWRAANDAAIELPLKIALAHAAVLDAELRLARAHLAETVGRQPDLAARLRDVEQAFEVARVARDQAAVAARVNGGEERELRDEIRRLEREIAAHRRSSVGRVA